MVRGMFMFCCWQRTGIKKKNFCFSDWLVRTYLVLKDVFRRAIGNSRQEHRIITDCVAASHLSLEYNVQERLAQFDAVICFFL